MTSVHSCSLAGVKCFSGSAIINSEIHSYTLNIRPCELVTCCYCCYYDSNVTVPTEKVIMLLEDTQFTYNLTMRPVREPLLQWESSKYYIPCV